MNHKIFILSVILFLFPITIFSAEWTIMTSVTTNHLYGIWGSSGTDIFAVGGSGTILHYNGVNWSLMNSGTTKTLFSVWGSSSTDVFAVGMGDNPGNLTIMHYDGTRWSKMNVPLLGISGVFSLNGVWGSSSTDVFAVGEEKIRLHYDGANWTYMDSILGPDLHGIWGSGANNVFAVGINDYYNPASIVYRYNGSTWSLTSTDTTYILRDVWGNSATDVFAVGGDSFVNGAILHYNGISWSQVYYIPDDSPLYGVWGSSGMDVFAVGKWGTILHYDGTQWTDMTSITGKWLEGVWGSSGTDVFVVGWDGTILHYSEPTVITLSSFIASSCNKKIILEWITESETDNAGFNLYRSTSENGDYIKIHTSLIPAQGSSTQGASYEFVDTDVKNRKTYYYKLEDLDLNGGSTMHGPVSAMPRRIYGLKK